MAQLCTASIAMPSCVQSAHVFPKLKTGNVKDRFRNEKMLGSGCSSTVYKCYDKVTNLPYACKMISKRDPNFDEDDVRHEYEIMRRLRGQPNVVSLRDVFEDSDHVSLVMDLCSGGDLFDFIAQQHPAGCSEQLVAHVMLQIMSAIRSCHAVGVVHGDVKPENIVLCESNTILPEVKLIDFGLSTITRADDDVTTIAGTPSYMAPEVFRRCYSCAADVWSAGCSMYKLVTGQRLFHLQGLSYSAAQGRQLRAYQQFLRTFPSSEACRRISENGRDVLLKMLAVDPSARLTVDEFFQHPWAVHHMDRSKESLCC